MAAVQQQGSARGCLCEGWRGLLFVYAMNENYGGT